MNLKSTTRYLSLANITNLNELVDYSEKILLKDGVILSPTDTVYGLICLPTSDIAISKIFAMKNRPMTRHLPIIVANGNQAKTMLPIVWNEPAQRLSDSFWPGALTLACGVRNNNIAWLKDRVEVGIRVPDFLYIQRLAEKIGPLLMTSANKHGEDTPHTIDGALGSLTFPPELVIDGGLLSGAPSTLVNVNLPTPVIERFGSIPKNDIERVIYHE